MSRGATYLAAVIVLGAMLVVFMSRSEHSTLATLSPRASAAPTTEPAWQTLLRAAPATKPATLPASRPTLPKEFTILQTRNPFTAGARRGGGAGGPEGSLVFKGVANIGDSFTAFIEDTGSKNVIQAAAGDAIARGRIKTISLDAIEYEVAGDSKRIEVGQNLKGEVAPPTPTSKPSPPAAPSGGEPTTAPAGDGTPPPTPPPGAAGAKRAREQ